MTFSRANPSGWNFRDTLTNTQINQIDINQSRAIDGYGGGTYNVGANLTIAPAGGDGYLQFGDINFALPASKTSLRGLTTEVFAYGSLTVGTSVGPVLISAPDDAVTVFGANAVNITGGSVALTSNFGGMSITATGQNIIGHCGIFEFTATDTVQFNPTNYFEVSTGNTRITGNSLYVGCSGDATLNPTGSIALASPTDCQKPITFSNLGTIGYHYYAGTLALALTAKGNSYTHYHALPTALGGLDRIVTLDEISQGATVGQEIEFVNYDGSNSWIVKNLSGTIIMTVATGKLGRVYYDQGGNWVKRCLISTS